MDYHGLSWIIMILHNMIKLAFDDILWSYGIYNIILAG